MSYSLSFSEAFYYDDSPGSELPSIYPKTVYQALMSLRDEQWAEIAREVFQCDPKHLEIFTVIDRIRETDTCSNLDSPVQVWIDEEGWYDVLVYDATRTPKA